MQNTVENFENVVRLDGTAYGIVQRSDIKRMTQWLPVGAAVLDVGCGFGLPTVQAAAFFKVSACDIPSYATRNDTFHEALMCERGIDFKWSKPTGFPYSDDSFDGVLLYAVIEHVTDKVGFLKECHRVLKPNGKIFMFRAVNKIAIAEKIAKMMGLATHGTDVVTLSQMRSTFAESGFSLNAWGYQGWLPENGMPKHLVYIVNLVLTHIPIVNKISHDYYFICTKQAG